MRMRMDMCHRDARRGGVQARPLGTRTVTTDAPEKLRRKETRESRGFILFAHYSYSLEINHVRIENVERRFFAKSNIFYNKKCVSVRLFRKRSYLSSIAWKLKNTNLLPSLLSFLFIFSKTVS